jgi:SWI/SNF-related matrix-associated actin-dependent regulator 1 of chromatin subfamily A
MFSDDDDEITPQKSSVHFGGEVTKKKMLLDDEDDDEDDDVQIVSDPRVAPPTRVSTGGWIKRMQPEHESIDLTGDNGDSSSGVFGKFRRGPTGAGRANAFDDYSESSDSSGDEQTMKRLKPTLDKKKKPRVVNGKKKRKKGDSDDEPWDGSPVRGGRKKKQAKKSKLPKLTPDLQQLVDEGSLSQKDAAKLMISAGEADGKPSPKLKKRAAKVKAKENLKKAADLGDFVVNSDDDDDEEAGATSDGKVVSDVDDEEEGEFDFDDDTEESSIEEDSSSEDGERFDEETYDDNYDEEQEELQARKFVKECTLMANTIRESLKKLISRGKKGNHDGGDIADGKHGTGGMKCVSSTDAGQLFPSGWTLKDYQLTGLNWLIQLRVNGVNGILADEMGLGKTVQAVAMLVYMAKVERVRGPHLIVIPASTKDNWMREIKRWAPDLNCLSYHGTQSERQDFRYEYSTKTQRQGVDILLSTYSVFEREANIDDRVYLQSYSFEFVICDEAHSLKNVESARFRNLNKLRCKNRLLLSGTPVQNNVKELIGMIRFAMPKMFKDKSRMDTFVSYFEKKYDMSEKKQMDSRVINEVRQIIDPFILRRLKSEVAHELPSKTEHTIMVDIAGEQKVAYNWLLNEIRMQRAGQGGQMEGMKISHLFSELRKAANHPLLIKRLFQPKMDRLARICWERQTFGNQSTEARVREYLNEEYSDYDIHGLCSEFAHCSEELDAMRLSDEMLLASSKFDFLLDLLPKLVSDGHRMLIFSQWTSILDVLELLMEQLELPFLRLDGSTQVVERQALIDQFNNNPDKLPVFLLSTRAGGLGINLTSADTVILHDIDFNPQIDRQAVDRVHRLGQKKPVTVYRLICKGTVDEKIQLISESKYVLDQAILGERKKGKESKDSTLSSTVVHQASMKELLEGALNGGDV